VVTNCGAAKLKKTKICIRELKGIVEDLTGLAGQLTLLAAAVYGFVHFFSK